MGTQRRKRAGRATTRAESIDAGNAEAASKSQAWVVLVWLLAVAVMAVALWARIRLLDIPLERDEGEYAYTGQLMLHGIAPYRFAANMKLPGAAAAYAAIMTIFGQTAAGIHLGYLLVNAGAVVLLFFLGRRVADTASGLAAASCYALMSLGPSVLGNAAHATHFVVLPALAALLLLLRWRESRRAVELALSGLLFGTAFLMKQQGVFFALFGCLYIVWAFGAEWRSRAAAAAFSLFAAAAAAPYAITCAILWHAGVFRSFWFWTVTYARQYAAESSLSQGWANLTGVLPPILKDYAGIWILAGVGLVALWWKPAHRSLAMLLTGLLGFSALAVSVGFYYREHYFVLALPALALLAAAGVDWLRRTAGTGLALAALAAALVWSVAQQGQYLFEWSPREACRAIYYENPFPEAPEIANYIAANTKPDTRIAILGSEPEILFYSHRISATGYIYMYPLMETQPFALQMQNGMIHDIEAARPEYIVFVEVETSWLRGPDSPPRLLDWWKGYSANYELAGVADMWQDQTVYRWGAEAAAYRTRSPNRIFVVKRKAL